VEQRHAPRQMIENQQRLRRDVAALRQARQLGAIGRQPLEVADDVVTGGADQAAAERYPVDRRPELGALVERSAHQVAPLVGAGRPRPALAVDDDMIRIQRQRQAFTEPEERIPGEALPAFHALEQESRFERSELHVRRYRRIEVGGDVER
jgi:hypothetical protein